MKKITSKIIITVIAVIMPILLNVICNNSLPTFEKSDQQHVMFPTIVIDAGHGGVDGGATSSTGTLESHINLEIATRLNDFLHLLGIHTFMIRNSDISVYTSGTTIAEKKVSDLKERVRLINEMENAILISIHQNFYPQGQYHGAQVFYGPIEGSKNFAAELQDAFLKTINIGSSRQIKPATGIFLIQNIQCPGVLIECGFISNPSEAVQLESPEYQKKISTVIATTFSRKTKAMQIT